MKKSILTIIVLGCAILSQSQEYRPFLHNIGWCLESYAGTGSLMTSYINKGDTAIGSHSYSKLLKESELFLVREDTLLRKAWVIMPGSPDETLLYDFDIPLGAQIDLSYAGFNPVAYSVAAIDSILTPLGWKKRISLTTTDTVFAAGLTWIEGIGSTYGPVYLADPTFAPGFMSSGFCLICAYFKPGEQSYEGLCGISCDDFPGSACHSFITGIQTSRQDETVIIMENLNSGQISIRLNKGMIAGIRIFTIEGKLLMQVPNPGGKEILFMFTDNMKGLFIIEVTTETGTRIIRKIIR